MRIFLLGILLFVFSVAKAQEISLFNSGGKATAYIADDDDLTIYLWSGKPVAYISEDNIYGFNGKHLGWWVKGIIYDHDGHTVGAKKNAANMSTEYEPYKAYKEYKPYKSYKEYAPYKPYWSGSWADLSFSTFLMQGIAE